MTTTRTGNFGIGFRRGWSDWQKDLSKLIAFAKEQRFACLDFGPIDAADLEPVLAAGLKVGSVDLKQWSELASPDPGQRKAAVDANMAMITPLTKRGVRSFFAVIIPLDKKRPRPETFSYIVEGYGELARRMEPLGARIALEGWPNAGGENFNFACTPADCRALFKAVGSDALGVNFDPSHLIRMGIDPVRFLGEFAPRVAHVHGKDTEILDDELYEHGNLGPATFAKGHGFGAHAWRYTLPGHGIARWTKLLAQLKAVGYQGFVSVELEDENFNGTEDGEKRSLITSRDFLAGV